MNYQYHLQYYLIIPYFKYIFQKFFKKVIPSNRENYRSISISSIMSSIYLYYLNLY